MSANQGPATAKVKQLRAGECERLGLGRVGRSTLVTGTARGYKKNDPSGYRENVRWLS